MKRGASAIRNLKSLLAAVSIGLISTVVQGAEWSEVKALNPGAANDTRADDYTPAIATDGRDNWVAVWGSNVYGGLDYETYAARSANNGTSWTGLVTVNSDAASASDAQDITQDLVTDGNGTWIASWMKNNIPGTGGESEIAFSRSTNNGTTWSQFGILNSYYQFDNLQDQYPSLASGGDGTFVAIWGAYDPTNSKYYMATSRSSDNGVTWQPSQMVYPTELYTGPTHNTHFRLATDKEGTWIAIAHSTLPTTASTGTDFDIIGFRSFDNGVTWSAPFPINSDATSDNVPHTYPHIACDAQGIWVATWSGQLPGGYTAAYVSRSTDDGLTWSTAQKLSMGTGPKDASPVAAGDGHGSWIAAWENRIKPTEYDIEYAESNDGGLTWTPRGFLNSNATSDTKSDGLVKIASDQRGRWVAVWTSENVLAGGGGPDGEIYYSVGAFGIPQLEISADVLNFGGMSVDAGPTDTLELFITNPGTGPLEFTSVGLTISGPSAPAFEIVNNPSMDPIAAGESRRIVIRFDPNIIGAHLALLRVYTEMKPYPDLIELHGFGTGSPCDVEAWPTY